MEKEVFDEGKKKLFRLVVQIKNLNRVELFFSPSRRKQAKGQDIIQWEQENTFKLSKRSPSSPWGNARPVNTHNGCPAVTSSPPKVQIESFVPSADKLPKTPSKSVDRGLIYINKYVWLKNFKSWAESPMLLNEIMEAEKRDEKLRKQRKPLSVIELEERAMVELAEFYKLQFPTDTITVTRAAQTSPKG